MRDKRSSLLDLFIGDEEKQQFYDIGTTDGGPEEVETAPAATSAAKTNF
jgi:hypothetical protein